jgi:hypothetical protein
MADLSDEYMSDAESVISEEDFFESGGEENLPSPKKKTKAKAKTQRMDMEETVEVLGDNRNKDAAKPPAKGNGKTKTVEEMYQKKTQLEHILLRPDTYSKFSQELLKYSHSFPESCLESNAVSNILVSLSLIPSSSSFSRIGGTSDAAHVRVE